MTIVSDAVFLDSSGRLAAGRAGGIQRAVAGRGVQGLGVRLTAYRAK